MADDWLYNDEFDVHIKSERDRLDSTDSRVLDGDLLDDVLTAPSAVQRRSSLGLTNEDELLGMKEEESGIEGVLSSSTAVSVVFRLSLFLLGLLITYCNQGYHSFVTVADSGSARFNAEQMARMVHARIEANRTSQGVIATDGTTLYSREPNRKNSIFIGNLTWWTTDQDLILLIREVGLSEVTAIKFFENRANGQSKGYALIELMAEDLAMAAPEKLQQLEIHGQKPVVIHASKISPHQFEIKCNQAKSGDYVPPSKPQKTSISQTSTTAATTSQFRPPVPLPGFPPPSIPGLQGQGSILPDPTTGLPPFPPPMMPPMPPGLPPMMNPLVARPGMMGVMKGWNMHGMPPPIPPGFGGDHSKGGVAPHLNPAFLQDMQSHGGNMAELFAQAAARFKSQAAAMSGLGGPKQPSEEEASDANQRNRAISSSAITRAMSDANAGDFESSVDTLKMAITLIKQSVTAGTETSQILIQSLQDCLHGIEQQAAHYKRSRGTREHRPHDDRGRSSGHKSSKHHRDRSRERRR